MTKKCRVWSAERGMGARDLAVGDQARGEVAPGGGALDRINGRDRIIYCRGLVLNRMLREFSFTDIHSNSLLFTDIHPIWKKIVLARRPAAAVFARVTTRHFRTDSNPFQTIPMVSNRFQPFFKKIMRQLRFMFPHSFRRKAPPQRQGDWTESDRIKVNQGLWIYDLRMTIYERWESLGNQRRLGSVRLS